MSNAEIFLLLWAMVATTLAVLFQSLNKKLIKALAGGMLLVQEIAKGEATVRMVGDELKVERVNHGLPK